MHSGAIVDLAPLVKSRAISSTDLTKMYLARMQKYSPKLLCLITSTEELALQQAAAADKEIRAGHYRGPLHGIPFGLKDLFDTKGILTTFGAEPYQTRVADKDATVVERLRNAGAVLIGEALDGRAGAGRAVVQGHDEDAVEHGADVERIERRARLPPRPRAWWASRWGPRRWGRSFRPARHAAPWDCGPPTGASAATGRWR